MAKQASRIIIAAAIIVFLIRCANQLPPGGGEIDKIPPEIVETYPAGGSINFHDDYLEITFSEYVEKRSAQEAIFISPPIQKGIEYDWSGKSLDVYFKDSLKLNTTYTVTVGADVQDINNRNKMVQPFSFTFSTGSKIDSGKIEGKIYDPNPIGVMVYAYRCDTANANPMLQKPDYTSQVGKNGKYVLPGLGNGRYNVFAFRDKLMDFKYQRNDDEYGVQSHEIFLSDSIQKVDNIDFLLTIEDTIPPQLSNVAMLDRNHFLVEFNEPIDSVNVSAENFYLYDSTSRKKIPARYFFKGDAKGNKYNIAISDSLTPGDQIYLFDSDVYDKSQNKSGLAGTPITVNSERDTTLPKLIKAGGTLPENKVDYDIPVISMKFNDGFNQDTLQNSIKIFDTNENLFPFEIVKHDDAWFDIKVTKKLRPNTAYNLSLNLANIVDAAGNKIDSVYKYKFTTINDLDFTGVSGTVSNVGNADQIYVILQSAEKINETYNQKVTSQYKFNLDKVLPGKYLIWSFIDRNDNGRYNYGKVNPFRYSEEFIYYPDTLNLRARWPVGDVNINFNKK